MSTSVYHGSFWVPENDQSDGEGPFFEPDPGFSDHQACFFTNEANAARWFTSFNMTSEDQKNGAVRVILKGELASMNALIIEPGESLFQKASNTLGQGEIDELDHLYQAVRQSGYDALIVRNNYNPGDDIAAFNQDAFQCTGVALQKPDGEFTQWLDPGMAARTFERMVDQALRPEKHTNHAEIHQGMNG